MLPNKQSFPVYIYIFLLKWVCHDFPTSSLQYPSTCPSWLLARSSWHSCWWAPLSPCAVAAVYVPNRSLRQVVAQEEGPAAPVSLRRFPWWPARVRREARPPVNRARPPPPALRLLPPLPVLHPPPCYAPRPRAACRQTPACTWTCPPTSQC